MKTKKALETIKEARERLTQEIEKTQSMESIISHTVAVLKLVAAHPPQDPEFYRKLKEIQDRRHKLTLDKLLLDVITEN